MKNSVVKILVLVLCISLAIFGVACKKDKSTAKKSEVEPKPSVGLEYELNKDGASYTVVGLGICEDTAVVIPASYNELPVTTIGEEAFACCENLKSLRIGENVTIIEDYAFCLSRNLAKFEVSKKNPAYKAISGNLYTKDGKTLVQYAIGKTDASFVVPKGVETIGYMAFYESDNLTSVVVGNNVKTIGERAFKYCSYLYDVELGDSVTTIGVEAFASCDYLLTIKMGKSVTTIEKEAFYFCSSLMELELPDSVTTIGDYSFYWCYGVSSVEIGKNVTQIGVGAFESCTSLTSVYYKGTSSEWENILIGSLNERLKNATRYYI